LDRFLPQFRQDLVLALEFVFEGSALAVLGILKGLEAFVGVREGRGTVLEELLLPKVEEVDGELLFLTEVGDRLLLQEVESKQGYLLLRGKGTTLASHEKASTGVLPLTPRKANSSSH
jgi:hypothetical protein